jgi:uncharacterized protein YndB with AHSA1/START domain
MSAAEAGARRTGDREIVLTRVFEAPRELVFRAWTESIHIAQWWGPTGFRTTIYEMDVRPGGVWRFVMHGPDGRDYKNKIIFHEIVKNKRLTYTHMGEDEDPNVFEVTVTFAPEGNNTQLTMQSVFPTAAERERVVREYGAIEGGKQTLERLAHHVTKMSKDVEEPPSEALVITREFDAPRDMVFNAWTDAEHLKRWWGPAGCEVGTCKVELRPGGSFLYSMRMLNAPEIWGKFLYREITPPDRLVFCQQFFRPRWQPDAPSLQPHVAAGNSEHGHVSRGIRQNATDAAGQPNKRNAGRAENLPGGDGVPGEGPGGNPRSVGGVSGKTLNRILCI